MERESQSLQEIKIFFMEEEHPKNVQNYPRPFNGIDLPNTHACQLSSNPSHDPVPLMQQIFPPLHLQSLF